MAALRSIAMFGLVGAIVVVGIVGSAFLLSSSGPGLNSSASSETTTMTSPPAPQSSSPTERNLTSTSSTNSCESSLTLTPINTKTGMAIGGITYDSTNNEIYFVTAQYGPESLYELNTMTNSITNVSALPGASSGIIYDPINNDFYITNGSPGVSPASNTVTVVSGSNYKILKNIPVGTNPIALAFDPSSGEIFVANTGDSTISVINGSSNSIVTSISVSAAPLGFAYDQHNGNMYVTAGARAVVDVINSTTNTVQKEINVGGNNTGLIAYDGFNGDVYVASYNLDGITVANRKYSIALINESNVVSNFTAVPYAPSTMAYNPTDLNMYIGSNGTGGTIFLLNSFYTSSFSEPGSGLLLSPYSFAYDANNGVLYLSSLPETILEIAAGMISPSCYSTTTPTYKLENSSPSIISSESNHTFVLSYGLTPSQNALLYFNTTLGSLTKFSGNPGWQKLSNGTWIVTNYSAISNSKTYPLWNESQLAVSMENVQISANQTGEFTFDVNVGSGLTQGYYGLNLNVYVEFSSPFSIIPVVYTGYIPLQVVSSG